MKTTLSIILMLGFQFAALPAGLSAQEPLRIVISTRHPVVNPGNPIEMAVKLTNTSQQVIDTSTSLNMQTGLDANLDIDIRSTSGVPALKKVYKHPELAAGQAYPGRSLNPGQTLKEDFDLTRAYSLKPGQYTIQVSWSVPKNLGGGVVKSNKITVTVTP